ncbi:MAG: hypothetical protein ABJE95_15850 [Byssovorax sp.]
MGDPDTTLATRLACTFGILNELSPTDIEDVEIEPIEKLSLSFNLDTTSYVYFVQIEHVSDSATTVWILFPDDPAAEPLRAADRARVPADGTWITPRATGKVRALSATRALLADDLIKLLGGREPIPGTVTVKNAKTGARWP